MEPKRHYFHKENTKDHREHKESSTSNFVSSVPLCVFFVKKNVALVIF